MRSDTDVFSARAICCKANSSSAGMRELTVALRFARSTYAASRAAVEKTSGLARRINIILASGIFSLAFHSETEGGARLNSLATANVPPSRSIISEAVGSFFMAP